MYVLCANTRYFLWATDCLYWRKLKNCHVLWWQMRHEEVTDTIPFCASCQVDACAWKSKESLRLWSKRWFCAVTAQTCFNKSSYRFVCCVRSLVVLYKKQEASHVCPNDGMPEKEYKTRTKPGHECNDCCRVLMTAFLCAAAYIGFAKQGELAQGHHHCIIFLWTFFDITCFSITCAAHAFSGKKNIMPAALAAWQATQQQVQAAIKA